MSAAGKLAVELATLRSALAAAEHQLAMSRATERKARTLENELRNAKQYLRDAARRSLEQQREIDNLRAELGARI